MKLDDEDVFYGGTVCWITMVGQIPIGLCCITTDLRYVSGALLLYKIVTKLWLERWTKRTTKKILPLNINTIFL